MTLKAIETVYNGYRFRSRIEARWAVFFDTLGVPYEYEKEGYDLGGVWYLPDFWLPQQQCWVEIKGEWPTSKELYTGGMLSSKGGHAIAFFWGSIQSHPFDMVGLIPIWHAAQNRLITVSVLPALSRRNDMYLDNPEQPSADFVRPKILSAYTAARQARFEHR